MRCIEVSVKDFVVKQTAVASCSRNSDSLTW